MKSEAVVLPMEAGGSLGPRGVSCSVARRQMLSEGLLQHRVIRPTLHLFRATPPSPPTLPGIICVPLPDQSRLPPMAFFAPGVTVGDTSARAGALALPPADGEGDSGLQCPNGGPGSVAPSEF
ncbi:hypothetical protein SKAU_G00182030 [Synaphobranchus kaupii]|uniref:Uncharacterized protein n=1 Tax=Synaphobranchus kaupii TaxID=118154 RepID=A0A9Q1FBY8_SYNKA|nr:hypothetical protein SKAU_G00182030 [Synaphobranchus kaupii]